MTLPLTPDVLEAAYTYLRTTPPFRGWRLPSADEVEFAVTKRRDCEGDHGVYRYYTNEHIITVSSYYIKTTADLMIVMAHEMIHAKQEMDRTARRGGHNKEFHRLAKRVCAVHGWNYRLFL